MVRDTEQDGDGWYAKSLAEVAKFFRVSLFTVKEWRAWMPPKGPYGYDLAEIAERRYRRMQSSPQVSGVTGDGEMSDEDTLNLKAARLLEIQEHTRQMKLGNDADAGELLPKKEVEQRIVQWAVRFRAKLLAMATGLSNRVPGKLKASTKVWARNEIEATLRSIRDMQVTGATVEQLVLEEAAAIMESRKAEESPPERTGKSTAGKKKTPRKKVSAGPETPRKKVSAGSKASTQKRKKGKVAKSPRRRGKKGQQGDGDADSIEG